MVNDIYGHRAYPRALKELTNAALARLMLRRIWYIQDECGASMGRDPRNMALEAAMHLLPLNSIARYIDLEMLPFEEIIAEVVRRRPIVRRRDEGSYKECPPLAKLDDMELAGLLLRTLKSVYRNLRKNDLRDRLREERELLEIALEFFPPQKAIPKPLPWNTEGLIKEVDERRCHAFRKK